MYGNDHADADLVVPVVVGFARETARVRAGEEKEGVDGGRGENLRGRVGTRACVCFVVRHKFTRLSDYRYKLPYTHTRTHTQALQTNTRILCTTVQFMGIDNKITKRTCRLPARLPQAELEVERWAAVPEAAVKRVVATVRGVSVAGVSVAGVRGVVVRGEVVPSVVVMVVVSVVAEMAAAAVVVEARVVEVMVVVVAVSVAGVMAVRVAGVMAVSEAGVMAVSVAGVMAVSVAGVMAVVVARVMAPHSCRPPSLHKSAPIGNCSPAAFNRKMQLVIEPYPPAGQLVWLRLVVARLVSHRASRAGLLGEVEHQPRGGPGLHAPLSLKALTMMLIVEEDVEEEKGVRAGACLDADALPQTSR
ncbi:hypothetical protein VOLCADRAFT_98849 [Volvox carteri f. nagariensis]|uniref:Uncharacterized protein n=1 Tax=Volvox carteri f. nagariensis TaxID=3068 RepID=D8UGF7_VOLCA|nr:uncharacterized protein VOLCADRAFT_98849 [Volvox carteri f. nagariensis]EFJ41168.1 hypothetical protein VOLCADRAFT_98849 [Volvox carteri f. nagariensis]|eukprot:XP_002957736.1 hypothetical protein VOLCADRAFT_98849 [Volvox carteri f. nagariensis]